VYTGEKQYSGTGRNRQTINIVKPLNSYHAVPATLDGLVPKGGEIIQAAADLKYLSNYWNLFGQYSKYEVYFDGKFSQVLVKTRTGDKIVGASTRTKTNGALILLPPLDLETDKFVKYSEKDGPQWTKEALKLGHKLLEAILEIDTLLKSDQELTPPPDWTQASEWRLPSESLFESKIAKVNSQIKQLRNTKTELLGHLWAEGSFRRLLYEKGKPLESAVIDSLRLLSFTAQPFRDSHSEFDAVFICEEGRFLGEVEGKDNKSVNIDKLSQLERNLSEDFAKEEVTEYAKGVLFGNAQRLTPLKERGDFFTEKCIKGAARLKAALIRTPDLFPVVRYIRESRDKDFAAKCRQAILACEGAIVVFPSPPNRAKSEIAVAESKTDSTSDANAV
ncbi:MAG: hypothetical protein O7D34_02825, partial [Ignavibacteria bacterium]|nr:hypothetical protein [Ignavibacteria bacterium]